MTVKVRRLHALLPSLTVPERLDALLNAYHDEKPFDRGLLDSIPRGDAERWNWLAGMLNATHTQLGWYIEYVEATVAQLELRQGMLYALQYAALAMDDHLFSILLDPEGDERRAGLLAKQDLVGDMSTALAKRNAEELAGRWLDVRLAEVAADSIAVECFGRNLVHPEMRDKLRDCKGRLEYLREGLKFWVEVELPEPEDADVARLLALLEKESER